MKVLFGSCIAGTVICTLFFVRFLLTPKSAFVRCDWFVSTHAQNILQNQPLPSSLFSYNEYIQELLTEIPALETIDIKLNRYKKLCIKAHARIPWIRINNNLVLTHDGFVIPSYFFNSDLVNHLPAIHADITTLESGEYNEQLFNFLRNLPKNFYPDVTIEWHNSTVIHITTPLFPGLIIITHASTLFNESLMQTLSAVCNDVQTAQRKNMRCYADVRFKNHVILSHKKGESL